MAKVDVTSEVVIHRPLNVVAEFAGDPTNAPRWYSNIRSVTWNTAPPLHVGSRLDFVAVFLGRELAYTYQVSELRPGARLEMTTADGPFPMTTCYTWTAVDGGTRMTLRNHGEPSGFAALGAPVVAAAMRRANRLDLEQLKRVLEGMSGEQA